MKKLDITVRDVGCDFTETNRERRQQEIELRRHSLEKRCDTKKEHTLDLCCDKSLRATT